VFAGWGGDCAGTGAVPNTVARDNEQRRGRGRSRRTGRRHRSFGGGAD
jgi:hypothetical protein